MNQVLKTRLNDHFLIFYSNNLGITFDYLFHLSTKVFFHKKKPLTPLYVHLILVVFFVELSSGLAVVSATEMVTGALAVTSEFFTWKLKLFH